MHARLPSVLLSALLFSLVCQQGDARCRLFGRRHCRPAAIQEPSPQPAPADKICRVSEELLGDGFSVYACEKCVEPVEDTLVTANSGLPVDPMGCGATGTGHCEMTLLNRKKEIAKVFLSEDLARDGVQADLKFKPKMGWKKRDITYRSANVDRHARVYTKGKQAIGFPITTPMNPVSVPPMDVTPEPGTKVDVVTFTVGGNTWTAPVFRAK